MSQRIRLFAFGVLVVWATLLLLGSWYPFDFQGAELRDACKQWWRGLRLAGQSRSDLAINLIAGVPLGFCSGLLIRARSTSQSQLGLADWAGAFLAVCLIALYAFGIEIGQAWFSRRVPSSLDTLAQTVGASGAMLVALSMGAFLLHRLNSVSDQAGSNRLMSFLDLYFVGYVIWMWMPFIPDLSPSELKQKWLHGVDGMGLSRWSSEPWTALYQAGVATLAAVPIGAWWYLWPNRRGIAPSVWGAALWGGLCVAGLELSQLFIQSRVVGLDDCFWSAVGAIAGVGICRWKTPGGVPSPAVARIRPSTRFGLLIVGCAVYLAASLAPFDLVTSKAELIERWQAFRGSWRSGMFSGNDYAMFTNSLRTLLFTIPLGALFGFARNGWRPEGRITILFLFVLLMISGIAEAIQFISREHSVDAVSLFARLFGGLIGVGCLMCSRTPKSEQASGCVRPG
ncbi:VanZ family protein [Roseiconus lacunae]|uniref:VanZ family protein n=1 Tax=Roseiconus lacunae TaxID=2605694 RepID=UPI003092908C|nr:VanZ family protein [Stieleria sp. HD01]